MLELNKDNFDDEVLNYTEKPVFVDFWGDHKYEDKIKFASLNISSARRLAIGQKVLGLPTMIIYKNGEKISTVTPDKISNLEDVENFIKGVYETL